MLFSDRTAWTARLRGKVEIPVEQQCAEPDHQQDQHSATTSAATVRADLAGDELAVESPAEEPIVSPVAEVARSEVPEAAGPNAMMVVGRSASPAAEEQCAMLAVVDQHALPEDRSAFPVADRSEWLEVAAPCSAVDQRECPVVMALNAAGVH